MNSNTITHVYMIVLITGLGTGCRSKESDDGQFETQFRNMLAEKKSFTQADGTYEIAVEKIDGEDLINIEIREKDATGSLTVTKGTQARIRIDEKHLNVQISEGSRETTLAKTEFVRQEFQLPRPQFAP